MIRVRLKILLYISFVCRAVPKTCPRLVWTKTRQRALSFAARNILGISWQYLGNIEIPICQIDCCGASSSYLKPFIACLDARDQSPTNKYVRHLDCDGRSAPGAPPDRPCRSRPNLLPKLQLVEGHHHIPIVAHEQYFTTHVKKKIQNAITSPAGARFMEN